MVVSEDDGLIKYVISEDKRFSSSLILTDASEYYLRLKRLDASSIGSEIESIYNYRDVIAIKDMLEQLKESSEDLTFFRQLGQTLLRLTVSYSHGNMHFSGIKVNRLSEFSGLLQTCRLSHLPFDTLSKTKSDSVLVRVTEDKFVVETIGQRTSQITGLNIGRGISGIVQFMYCVNPEMMIRQCAVENVRVQYLDIYVRGSMLHHLLIECIPINHDEKWVLVNYHLLDRQEYYQLQMPHMEIAPPELSMHGKAIFAVFSCINNQFELLRSSHSFNKIYDNCTVRAILVVRLLDVCRKTGALKCTILNISGVRYFGCVIPSADNCTFYMSMIPFDELQDGMDGCLSVLTPREREIAQYIINGETTKEIAEKLIIAEGTVKKTISNIYEKLHVSSKVELIQHVLQYR